MGNPKELILKARGDSLVLAGPAEETAEDAIFVTVEPTDCGDFPDVVLTLPNGASVCILGSALYTLTAN